jgi:hypothetical protein
MVGININIEKIREFCRKSGIRKLSIFGSAARNDMSPQSDIDLMVEFEQGVKTGFIRLAALERALSDILGRKTDLNTPGSICEEYIDEVMRDAETIYVSS